MVKKRQGEKQILGEIAPATAMNIKEGLFLSSNRKYQESVQF